ncbi:MAG: clan AA aspartic protease [Chloroflexi bacterium SZAS-1]|nr:clan AA aspartic protease [Chloroflexi bacterium SZAS-1]
MFEDRTRLEFSSRGYVAVPLCEGNDLVCCAAAGPGGRPLRVMFDTGTDPSAVDAGLAQRLALATGGSGLGVGAVSDAVPFTEAVLPWLRIGDLIIRDLFAPAVALGSAPFEVDVVLGYNVLRQVVLHIDYRRRMLTLAHPDIGAAQMSQSPLALPLVFFEHFPALSDVTIDGVPVALATLDTGSNAALTIGADLGELLGVQAGRASFQFARGIGFGGGNTVLRGGGWPVRLGPLELTDIELDLPQTQHGDLGRAGRANIGNRLLARFAAITLDYERQLLLIEQD